MNFEDALKKRNINNQTHNDKVLKIAQEKLNKIGKVIDIPITSLEYNPHQPRLEIKPYQIEELANSIKSQGLLQPILITPKKEDKNKYYIVAGHRRYEAHKLLNKPTIKAYVIETNENSLITNAIVENLQRENLNIIENAIAIKNYKETFNKTYDEIAKELGKSKSLIIKIVNILNLPNEIINDVKQRKNSDIVALNMINSVNKSLVNMFTKEEIETFQKELYKTFTGKGRNALKEEINNILNKKSKQDNVNIKLNKNKLKIDIDLKQLNINNIDNYILEKALKSFIDKLQELNKATK